MTTTLKTGKLYVSMEIKSEILPGDVAGLVYAWINNGTVIVKLGTDVPFMCLGPVDMSFGRVLGQQGTYIKKGYNILQADGTVAWIDKNSVGFIKEATQNAESKPT